MTLQAGIPLTVTTPVVNTRFHPKGVQMPNREQRRAAHAAAKAGQRRSPEPPKPKVITIGYCYSERFGVAGQWHRSVVALLAAGSRAGLAFREIPGEGGPFLSRTRNHILEKHLGFGDDYLLMTDTDTIFSPEDVGLLLEADAAIAGALYYAAAPDGGPPWATALVEDEPGHFAPIVLPELPVAPDPAEFVPGERGDALLEYEAAVGMFLQELKEAEFQPQKVASVGMGLTLIKREVCEAMAAAHEDPFEYVGHTGEDITFCHRAADLGFDTILVPQARIGHLKAVVI